MSKKTLHKFFPTPLGIEFTGIVAHDQIPLLTFAVLSAEFTHRDPP
jgi:hypothetical protein